MIEEQNMHILIIEDQPELAKNIAQYLEQYNCVIDFANTGPQGLSLALENHYDVVLLDLMLPGLDGLEVCNQIRENATRQVPILMLTARDTLDDKILGFKKGADDYLTKPFALEELHMRCLALAQRNRLHQDKIFRLGTLRIDRKRQTVTRSDRPIELNSMSLKILTILADSYPQAVTRSELIQKLWGDDPTESDSLRSHIYQLRQSLDKPFDMPLIKTIHGIGFTLESDD